MEMNAIPLPPVGHLLPLCRGLVIGITLLVQDWGMFR